MRGFLLSFGAVSRFGARAPAEPPYASLRGPFPVKIAIPAIAAAFLVSAAAVVALFAAGCESADSYSISISPSYAELKPGQSVTLRAKGWSDYSWTLDNDTGVHLSGTTGSSVVLFAEKNAATGTVVRVTATAVGSGGAGSSSSSSSNSVPTTTSSSGYTASAKIRIH